MVPSSTIAPPKVAEYPALPRLALILIGGVILSCAGCATDAAPRSSRAVITAPAAEFYQNGPAQDPGFQFDGNRNYLASTNFGPDFQLPLGAQVTVLKKQFGFSQVRTDDGLVGYMANDQLRPAPVLARTAAIPQNPQIPRRKKAAPAMRPFEDQLDLTDVPLPLPG